MSVFQFAHQQLGVQASSETLAALEFVYGNLISNQTQDRCQVWQLVEDKRHYTLYDDSGKTRFSFRLESPEAIVSFFGSLLLYSASLTSQSLFVLHGQLLEKEGHGLLLLGEKGVGKTSITLNLISLGWESVCEDMIPVDVESRRLYPYQRAFGYKSQPTSNSHVKLIAGKWWGRNSASKRIEPLPLKGCSVIELCFPEGESDSICQVMKHVATILQSAHIASHNLLIDQLPVAEAIQKDSVLELVFERPLNDSEFQVLQQMDQTVSMVLFYGEAKTEVSAEIHRPDYPMLEGLGAEELKGMIDRHLLLSGGRNRSINLQERFQLIKTCQVSSVSRLIPGGSVEESARCLLEYLADFRKVF